MSRKIIYLMGFMSSGKSKLGKKLAERISYDFVDLDLLIEEQEGASVSAIFEQKGEAYFREVEADLLRSLDLSKPTLIALGGGTPCSDQNIKYIKSSGCSIYLKIDAAILIGRLKQKREKRPLTKGLSDADLSVKVQELMERREPYYLQADMVLEENNPKLKHLLNVLELS